MARKLYAGSVNMCSASVRSKSGAEESSAPTLKFSYSCETAGFSCRACRYFTPMKGPDGPIVSECRHYEGGCTCVDAMKSAKRLLLSRIDRHERGDK